MCPWMFPQPRGRLTHSSCKNTSLKFDLMCFVPLCNRIEVRCCSSEENWRHGLEQSNLFSIPLGRGSVEHSFPPSNCASFPWPKKRNVFLWVDAAWITVTSLWWGLTKRCGCSLWCTTFVLDGQLVPLHNWIENDGNSNQLCSKILSRHHVTTEQADGWHAAHWKLRSGF